MTLKPIAAKVLVRLIPKANITASGLVLVHDKPLHELARVEAVGPDVKYLHVGDVVNFDRYAATEARDGVIVVDESKVLAVIEMEASS